MKPFLQMIQVIICTIDAIGKATRAISSHIVEKEINLTQTKQRRLSNEQSLRPNQFAEFAGTLQVLLSSINSLSKEIHVFGFTKLWPIGSQVPLAFKAKVGEHFKHAIFT
jgi:hypothetical protein